MYSIEDVYSSEELNSIFSYNSETGILYWKAKLCKRIPVGSIAGTLNDRGYITVGLNSKTVKAHRIIWCMVYGEWPLEEIDHIDRNGANNKLSNLKEATRTENLINRVLPSRKKVIINV